MAAGTTNVEAGGDPDEEPASVRVENFLRCVETTRRRTVRVRLAFAAVGVLAATVGVLTAAGAVVPGAARFAASAGTLVADLLTERHDRAPAGARHLTR